MKKSRFTEAQIVGILKELDGGTPATELARRPGIHADTIRLWRDNYAGMESSDLVRMTQLEAENALMQRIIARQTLDPDAVKELISKNGWGPRSAKKRSQRCTRRAFRSSAPAPSWASRTDRCSTSLALRSALIPCSKNAFGRTRNNGLVSDGVGCSCWRAANSWASASFVFVGCIAAWGFKYGLEREG